MTEYVPTTDEMRNVYASVQALGIRSGPPGAIEYNHGKAQFDRWLNEIRAEAWDECVNQMPIDLDWKNQYSDLNPYRANEK